MATMKRPVFTFLSAASLVLCLAIGAAWSVSYWRQGLHCWPTNWLGAEMHGRGFYLSVYRVVASVPAGASGFGFLGFQYWEEPPKDVAPARSGFGAIHVSHSMSLSLLRRRGTPDTLALASLP